MIRLVEIVYIRPFRGYDDQSSPYPLFVLQCLWHKLLNSNHWHSSSHSHPVSTEKTAQNEKTISGIILLQKSTGWAITSLAQCPPTPSLRFYRNITMLIIKDLRNSLHITTATDKNSLDSPKEICTNSSCYVITK